MGKFQSVFFFRKLGCILQIHQMFSSIRYVLDKKHRDSREDLECKLNICAKADFEPPLESRISFHCTVESMILTMASYDSLYRQNTLPETNISLKIDPPWKRRFVLETIIFRGELAVSFREGSCKVFHLLRKWFLVGLGPGGLDSWNPRK